MPPIFLKASPGPRGRPDFKNAPNNSGQTAFEYLETVLSKPYKFIRFGAICDPNQGLEPWMLPNPIDLSGLGPFMYRGGPLGSILY